MFSVPLVVCERRVSAYGAVVRGGGIGDRRDSSARTSAGRPLSRLPCHQSIPARPDVHDIGISAAVWQTGARTRVVGLRRLHHRLTIFSSTSNECWRSLAGRSESPRRSPVFVERYVREPRPGRATGAIKHRAGRRRLQYAPPCAERCHRTPSQRAAYTRLPPESKPGPRDWRLASRAALRSRVGRSLSKGIAILRWVR